MSSLWIGVATVAVGAGTAAYGANQAKKGQKANQENMDKYIKSVQQNEKEAKKLFDEFIGGYNSSKEKLEGMSLQEYTANMVSTLNDPTLNEAYRNARNGDWEQAQQFAEEGSAQNTSIFHKVIDTVGGGNYQELLKRRDAAIFSEDAETLYKEARRLQAPKQAAGSVRRDENGDVIGGQRGDKFEFDISTTAIKEANDRVFEKSRTAIEDDRVAAARQQDRAIQFLPMLDYSGFASSQVVQPYQEGKLRSQLAMLQADANLASTAMAAAYGAPLAPAQIDTTGASALAASGTKMALGGLTDLYKDSRTNNPNSTGASAGRTHTPKAGGY
jgi:hypothetical protein